jgi:hypothetical protein
MFPLFHRPQPRAVGGNERVGCSGDEILRILGLVPNAKHMNAIFSDREEDLG